MKSLLTWSIQRQQIQSSARSSANRKVLLCSASVLYFSFGILIINTVRFYISFFGRYVKHVFNDRMLRIALWGKAFLRLPRSCAVHVTLFGHKILIPMVHLSIEVNIFIPVYLKNYNWVLHTDTVANVRIPYVSNTTAMYVLRSTVKKKKWVIIYSNIHLILAFLEWVCIFCMHCTVILLKELYLIS